MKATKALKKLARIEASLSDLIERFSASDHRGQEFLQNAKASVIRAKETVSLQASSRTAKNPNVKHGNEPRLKAISEPSKPKRKLSATGRKAIIAATKKRWALKRAEAAKYGDSARQKSGEEVGGEENGPGSCTDSRTSSRSIATVVDESGSVWMRYRIRRQRQQRQ